MKIGSRLRIRLPDGHERTSEYIDVRPDAQPFTLEQFNEQMQPINDRLAREIAQLMFNHNVLLDDLTPPMPRSPLTVRQRIAALSRRVRDAWGILTGRLEARDPDDWY